MGSLIHLVIQINLLLRIERYRQSETVLIELKALNHNRNNIDILETGM